MTLITLIIMAIVIWTYCDWKDAANKEKKRRHQQELVEARGFNRKPISPIPYNLRKKRWGKYFYDYTATPDTSKFNKQKSDNESNYSNSDLKDDDVLYDSNGEVRHNSDGYSKLDNADSDTADSIHVVPLSRQNKSKPTKPIETREEFRRDAKEKKRSRKTNIIKKVKDDLFD